MALPPLRPSFCATRVTTAEFVRECRNIRVTPHEERGTVPHPLIPPKHGNPRSLRYYANNHYAGMVWEEPTVHHVNVSKMLQWVKEDGRYPPGVGFARIPPVFLHPGDQMEVDIDRIGILKNIVGSVPLEASRASRALVCLR
jgi:hypothetical protein